MPSLYARPERPLQDFTVKYRFLSAEEGGRKTGLPKQTYRSDWFYEGDDIKLGIWMIWPEFEDEKGEVLPSLSQVLSAGIARMWIVNEKHRDVHRERIKVGVKGFLMEGPHKVAVAEVIRVDALADPTTDNH